MKKILISSIKFYKSFISPPLTNVFGHTCRFTPTCSQYTIDAIEKKGISKGLLFGLKRLLRCNPFTSPGYDPVN